jgi:hypothetical protein
MFHVRSGLTARENWHAQKLCPRKRKSLHAICSSIVLFLKVIARLVAVVLLLHPFSFSFFTAFTTLSFLLVLCNYLLHTCFLYSFGVHVLSSLSSLSTFVLLSFSYYIKSLKLFICYPTSLFFYLLLHIQCLFFFSFIPTFIFFYLLSFTFYILCSLSSRNPHLHRQDQHSSVLYAPWCQPPFRYQKSLDHTIT